MKHIIEELDIRPETHRALDFYLPGNRFAVLDIETSGLSPVYSSVILSGFITIDNRNASPNDDSSSDTTSTKDVTLPLIELNQLFATMPTDEEEILSKTARLLSDVDYIVTFNGRYFDVPFLEKRCAKYGIEFPKLFNLDLFVLLKYYSDLPKILPKMNQKTVETYAGIENLRQDRISGGESVDLYNQYLETASKDLERRILLHNSDDLKQLLRLLTLLKNADIHRSFNKTGFPIYGGRITGIELKKADLTIKGNSHSGTEYIAFPSVEAPYHFQMSGKDGSFEITLPCESKEDSIYVDVKTLLDDDAREVLSTLPSFVNDYIILKENKRLNYLDINLLAREISRLALERV